MVLGLLDDISGTELAMSESHFEAFGSEFHEREPTVRTVSRSTLAQR